VEGHRVRPERQRDGRSLSWGPAETGKNAGVLMPAPGVTTGAFEGSATLTDDQAKVLMAEQTYFNVHSAANPNGEVRGQVMKAQ
jgi:hypothetical protein